MNKRFVWLAAFLTLSTGARAGTLPGDDDSYALTIDQGYNSVTNRSAGHCVELGELRTQSGNVLGQSAEFQLLEISTESALRESLDITASGSLSFGFFGGGSARVKYANSVNKNSQSKYLMVHTRVSNQLELASSFKFTSEALQLIQRQGAAKEFVRQCGDEFVFGRRTGGEFYALFEFEMHSDEEGKQFSTAVSASGLGWKAAGEVNKALSQFNMFSQTQVRMLRIGGTGDFPQVSDISEFARTFPTLVEATRGGAPVTLSLLTKDYSGVSPVDGMPNEVALTRQRIVVERLAKMRDNAMEELRTLDFVRENRDIYRSDPGALLGQWELQLNQYLNRVMEATLACFQDIWQSCDLPTDVQMPNLAFPPRKECESTTSESCEVVGTNGCLVFRTVTKNQCK